MGVTASAVTFFVLSRFFSLLSFSFPLLYFPFRFSLFPVFPWADALPRPVTLHFLWSSLSIGVTISIES
jgi:hypothetical protein